ncbi:MAG: CehA/McbA family metallohydrolase [Lentisphaerae bacterium]|nr:CehA/McbA family metallohydrolase [Lentisphaerota bacterium]
MSLDILRDPKAHCTLCREFTYRLAWRPEKHYVAGTQLEIRSHCLRAFHSWRFTGFRMKGGDITFRWKVRPTVSERWHNPERVLLRARLPYGARQGEAVELELTVIPPVWAGVNNSLSVWTSDVPNNFRPDAPPPQPVSESRSACELTVTAGPVERFSVISRPMADAAGNVRTVLLPEDRFGNPSRFETAVDCELEWNGRRQTLSLRDPGIMELPLSKAVGRAVVSIPMNRLSAQENIANGRRTGDRLIVTGNPVWPAGPGCLRPAFGEFHWHTDISGDGQRPIREALRCARDILNMDFAAPGDHNPQGDQWKATVAALDEFNQPDRFATFFGWENGTDRGHENYYFTEPEHPVRCGGAAGITGGTPDSLIARLRELHGRSDFIAIPHHTNSVAEVRKPEDDSPFWHPYPWGEPQPYIPLVELMQIRGNQEQNVYADAWRGWQQNHGASVQDALARGHRLGFTGGTDNHCGWPGRVCADAEGKGLYPARSVILTGVWTPRVERQAIFDSLKARHTWAVWDTRALVDFSVNGAPAGDELTVTPGTALKAHIRLSAEDALQTVELVSEGRTVWQQSFAEPDIDVEIPIGVADRSTHFYLRALLRNGGLIYASPVFVTVAETKIDKEK